MPIFESKLAKVLYIDEGDNNVPKGTINISKYIFFIIHLKVNISLQKRHYFMENGLL